MMAAALSRSPKGHAPEAEVATPPESPRSPRPRWHWRDWPVVVKLAAVLLVPTIVALLAGVLRIVDQASAAPRYARISQIAGVQQHLADLISSLARERDLSTAFVAAGRVGDRRGLDGQFHAVDGAVRVVAGAAGQVQGLDFARSPLAALDALAPLRASVTTGFSPAQVIVTEYSDAIDPLIDLDAALTRQLDDTAVTNNAAAAHDLLAASEQVSRQHAIVSAALYSNRLSPAQIEDLRSAAVRLATEQDAVRATLAPTERANALAGVGLDAEQSRQRVLQLVLDRGIAGIPLNTSPADWDKRSALVAEAITAAGKGLRQQVDQTAQRLLQQVRTAAGLNSVILFFALGIGVLIGILVTRALLNSLGVLKRTALDVADRRLPEAMARIRDGENPGSVIEPVPVGSREEIGQVARAFDEVHSQAVRLAGEQAQLRANVNDIFVNLSRRTQGLVERQLKLIDRLESGEQDPQQLDNLFQLDHLATRMRRNSENLLVLAGTEAANRSGRPVRLIDVLRAAVSEVEQYQRLVLQQPPAVLVLGRTASDLVHLLSELLDNATQFSPPDSHVMVSSERLPDGAVAIEVADRGVGMTEAELAEANQRLSSPAAVDASVSRRMGLFVVGRLAGRHGIDVQLRPGEVGVGVCASVTMPARLVRAAAEPVEPVAALAAASGAVRATASTQGLAQALEGNRNGVMVPHPQQERGPETPASGVGPADGADAGAAAQQAQTRQAHTRQDQSGEISGEPAELPEGQEADTEQATDSSPAPPGPPPGPQISASPQVPGGSGTDLFRTTRASGPVPGQRATLQHSTPIFDDVASAWFAEHEAVPVCWTAPSTRGPAGATGEMPARPAQPLSTPSPGAPRPEAPLPAAPTPDAPPAGTAQVAAPAAGGSPALTRRQPGKTLSGKTEKALSESNGASQARPPGQPVPAVGSARTVDASAPSWGAGDEGWRAAQALAQPVHTEVTATGLPRRQPRALLVPGAAGEDPSTSAVPARSAEMVRGRLASYQQGIREGRQARASLVGNASGAALEQQDTGEETR
jgi:signal transduction histidine kinase